MKVLVLALALGAAALVPTAASATTSTSQDFSACMRSHGVQDFPDLEVSSAGRIGLSLEGTPFNPFSATYREALAACQSLLPSGTVLPEAPAAPQAPSIGDLQVPEPKLG